MSSSNNVIGLAAAAQDAAMAGTAALPSTPRSAIKGNVSGSTAVVVAVRHVRALCCLPCSINDRLRLSYPGLHQCVTVYVQPVVLAITVLLAIPLSFYRHADATLPYEKNGGLSGEVVFGWGALLHMSIWPIVVLTCAAGFVMAHRCDAERGTVGGGKAAGKQQQMGVGLTTTSNSSSHSSSLGSGGNASNFSDHDDQHARQGAPSRLSTLPAVSLPIPPEVQRCYDKIHSRWPFGKVGTLVVGLSSMFSIATTVQSSLQMGSPGWLWNPFMWGKYHVYRPNGIAAALDGLCVDEWLDASGDHPMPPLCLRESSWKALSADALSTRNQEDVDAVIEGIRYARQPDHGIIINVMSRDTIDAITPLRQNVEGLLPFFDKVAVVVFENDSKDGSRHAFKKWSDNVKDKYIVDVMECEEAKDCVFGESHRYDATEADHYFKSSAIGRMAEFRQRIVDHILAEDERYANYSHMVVVDLDLKVSLSPLGILHTLGKVPDAAVASSGRQSWPASMGSFINPYDFSAFRSIRTPRNSRILDLHQWFCELMPPGDRWRNQCDAVSPMHLMLVLGHDRSSGNEPYPVASAFNGATLYPIGLVKSSGAKYDWGEDGQQCEHIGFNRALKKTMFINPKWDMHIHPAHPGGPTGKRAMKNVNRIVFLLHISLLIFFQNLICMLLFVHSVLVLSTKVLYLGWTKILKGTKVQLLVLPWYSATNGTTKVKTLQIDLPESGSDYDEETAGLLSRPTSNDDLRKRGNAETQSPTPSI